MERMLKQAKSGEPQHSGTSHQHPSASLAHPAPVASVADSPYMAAQRKKLEGMFGNAVQLQQDDEETVQGHFVGTDASTVQRLEEEPLQGRFGTVQRVDCVGWAPCADTETVQRVEDEEEPVQGKFNPVQLADGVGWTPGADSEAVQRAEDEDEPVQGKFEPVQRAEEDEDVTQPKLREAPVQLAGEPQKKNNTGLPDNLKAGVESLSGISLDNVKVHYNSSQPSQLNALAFAQGTDIHVAPGQERHLPHEAWHVVQQALGRVRPTMQMREGVLVNDDAVLEKEADSMGGLAERGTTQAKLADLLPAHMVNDPGNVVQKSDWYSFGGGNVTPHIHCYNGGCHLKKAGGDRINLVQDGFKLPQSIHEAFEWVREAYPNGNPPLLQALRDSVRDFPVRENYKPFVP